mmetsp:Transcript_25707/g.46860  ORF Transcript_25707/g.46860 Transcript_25707/m.46860 type:complete len:210 (-) Transcript_25707:156-785(-)
MDQGYHRHHRDRLAQHPRGHGHGQRAHRQGHDAGQSRTTHVLVGPPPSRHGRPGLSVRGGVRVAAARGHGLRRRMHDLDRVRGTGSGRVGACAAYARGLRRHTGGDVAAGHWHGHCAVGESRWVVEFSLFDVGFRTYFSHHFHLHDHPKLPSYCHVDATYRHGDVRTGGGGGKSTVRLPVHVVGRECGSADVFGSGVVGPRRCFAARVE